MKVKQFKNLSDALLPHLPGYNRKGPMLISSPLNDILRGFFFEDSGFDPSKFYVWVFFLPLYVPTTHVNFNFGKRLGGAVGKRWTISDPRLNDELLACVQQEGMPFLSKFEHPSQVAETILKIGHESNPYTLEAVAYSLAMTDDFPAAQLVLNRLTKMLDKNISWQSEMNVRSINFREMMRSDPLHAKQQLAEWKISTMKALGL